MFSIFIPLNLDQDFFVSLISFADQYALSKYIAANSRATMVESQAVSLSNPKQAEVGKIGIQTDESELRLAQLQHQLPANEAGALMQLVEGAAGEDKDDDETRECKTLFKDLKIFLSREVSFFSFCFNQLLTIKN